MKLSKRKHSHTIFICKNKTFIELEGIEEIYLRVFKFRPIDLPNSIRKIFTFHCDKKILKYYTKSEVTVRYTHFVVSKVNSNLKVRLNWLMSVTKLTYKILLFVKTFSSKDFFSYFKNNSPYFLIYNAEEYEIVFEEDFIIVDEFVN